MQHGSCARARGAGRWASDGSGVGSAIEVRKTHQRASSPRRTATKSMRRVAYRNGYRGQTPRFTLLSTVSPIVSHTFSPRPCCKRTVECTP